MDITAVLAEIREAFPAHPLPDVTLRQGQLADQTLAREISEEEWSAEGKLDARITWGEIDSQTLRDCDAALSHSAGSSFVYYLPAFLCYAIQHLSSDPRIWDQLTGAVIFAVTNRSNHNLSRLKRLDDPQINAVIAFLRAVRDTGGLDGEHADEALRLYWETPDAWRRTLIVLP